MRRVSARRAARAWAACLLAIGLAALACARPHAGAAGAPPIHRVLVYPLNVVVPMPTGLESGAASVSEALDAWLRAQGLAVETLPAPEARAAWIAAAQELRAELGAEQMNFDGAAKVLARTLHHDRAFDALVVPWLALRPARVHGRTVAWDGVTRTLQVIGDQGTHQHFLIEDFNAEAAAPSLEVWVLSGEGKKLFDGVGGLDLTHAMVIRGDPPKIGEQRLPPAQILSDHANVSEGIGLALAPLRRAAPPGESH